MSDYMTVKNEGSDEFTEKRSRFIGYAKPVSTQDEAWAFISSVRSEHWDATHNVYAYVLRDGQTRRYSDDGEPSGTAGVPVLDVMLKQGVTDCAVVVTRYFGGVLLGAGGLVRAYSKASKIALDAAGIVRMSVCAVMKIICDYNFYQRLSALISDMGASAENIAFSEKVEAEICVPKVCEDIFCAKLSDMSLGKYSAVKIGEKYAQM